MDQLHTPTADERATIEKALSRANPTTAKQQKTLKRLENNLDQVEVAHGTDGVFTSAVVSFDGRLFFGAAKRNTYAPTADDHDEDRGVTIALTRAAQSVVQ